MGSGNYWLEIFNSYVGSVPLLIIAFFEIIAVIVVYGMGRSVLKLINSFINLIWNTADMTWYLSITAISKEADGIIVSDCYVLYRYIIALSILLQKVTSNNTVKIPFQLISRIKRGNREKERIESE